MKRYLIHFQGKVQGVGFRATTRSIARDFQVVGQVRNLPDGRVELIVEGQQAQLDALLEAILVRMGRLVTHHTVTTWPATGEFGEVDTSGKGKVVIAY